METSGLNYLHNSVQLYMLDSIIRPGTMLGAGEDSKISKIVFLLFKEFMFSYFFLLIAPFVFNSVENSNHTKST